MGNANEIARQVKEINSDFDARVTIIGHLQRGGSPNCMDRVLASRLGYAAVDGLITGQKNVMAGIIDDQVAYTSLEEAISKDKPIKEHFLKMAEILAL